LREHVIALESKRSDNVLSSEHSILTAMIYFFFYCDANRAMALPGTVIYFLGYEYLREKLKRAMDGVGLGGWKTYAPLFAGAAARSTSFPHCSSRSWFLCFFFFFVLTALIAWFRIPISPALAVTMISPLELVRTRVQGLSSSSSGGATMESVVRNVVETVKARGPGTLWKGLSPTLWRDVPFSGIYWMGYESIGSHLRERWGAKTDNANLAVSFVAGATSGMVRFRFFFFFPLDKMDGADALNRYVDSVMQIAAAVTTPFDVAKTRQQTDSMGTHGELFF
jgi:hypothetical protein